MWRAAHPNVNGRVRDGDRLQSGASGDISERADGRFVVERILCPVDFSETSRVSLRYAVALAKRYHAEIRALHVVDVALAAGSAGLSGDYIRAARAEARTELRGRLQEFLAPAEAAGVLAKADIVEGTTVEEILDYAAAIRADVIVIGTRGLSGIHRLVLGSTAEKVLRSAPCPVLTVPPHADRPPSEQALFSRILCPVNFSEPSLKALQLALAVAQDVSGRITLLHALDQVVAQPAGEYIGPAERVGNEFADLERQARRRLRQLTPVDTSGWCHPEEAIVTIDTPVRAILRAAHNDQVELIVMSLRPRGGIDRMLFGSTTQAVIREATCPVVTVRAA